MKDPKKGKPLLFGQEKGIALEQQHLCPQYPLLLDIYARGGEYTIHKGRNQEQHFSDFLLV